MRWFLVLAISASFVDNAYAQQPTPITTTTVSSTILPEVVDGAGNDLPVAVSELPIEFFDDYSWRMFIALNWPSVAGMRGIPDNTKTVADTSGPRVWETWKSAYETVPPKGKVPTDWSSFDAIVPVNGIPEAGGGHRRVFGSITKFGDISQADFGSLAGPLVCQNKTFAHYEIRVNQAEFDLIKTKKLYDRAALNALTGMVPFPDGSIELKAAWREFNDSDSEEVRSRFYRTKALVKDYRNDNGVEKELGLIGLHIVQKTPLRPQWVWSSFEHVDNVPAVGQTPAPGSKLSLNNPSAPQSLTPDTAVDPVSDTNYLTATGEPKIAVSNVAQDIPMQVVRQIPLHPKTVAMNSRYQAKLAGTVWANYMLVVTQWPTNPASVDGDPFPPDPSGSSDDISISNTTMETYFQSSSSCIGCHVAARKTDFVFFPRVHAQNHDPGPAGTPTADFLTELNTNLKTLRQKSVDNQMRRMGLE